MLLVAQRAVCVGPARLGRRSKLLAHRLVAGDIAVLDHPSLDRVSAEELIGARVSAVLNAGASLSDSYPNLGPLLLAQAGVPLIDLSDDALFECCADGDLLEVSGGEVRRGGELIARGHELTSDELASAVRERGTRLDEALERFTLNTLAHMRSERELLGGRIELPALATDFRDRPALVVVRGGGYLEDLRALRPYVTRAQPTIVAVDGAAEGVLATGLRPQMIVGDMDSASDRALRAVAELVVHGYRDGRAPGADRLARLGLRHTVARVPGTSEDLALLIAAEGDASLIVTVGSQLNLVELLGRGRAGASSAFLTRLRLAERLVDAKGISRLL